MRRRRAGACEGVCGGIRVMPDYKGDRRCGRMDGCQAASGVRQGGFEAEVAEPKFAHSCLAGEQRERKTRAMAAADAPAPESLEALI